MGANINDQPQFKNIYILVSTVDIATVYAPCPWFLVIHHLFWTSVFYFGCMRKFEIVENWFSEISGIGRLIHLLSFYHLLIHLFSF